VISRNEIFSEKKFETIFTEIEISFFGCFYPRFAKLFKLFINYPIVRNILMQTFYAYKRITSISLK
jgi:hypothetical protein